MVTVSKIQQGVSAYIAEEFLGRLNGLQKWGVDIVTSLLLANSAEIFNRCKNNEAVKLMGVIDENDNIDIDKLYTYARAAAVKGPVTFSMPLVGAVTLNEGDVDKLYNCIVR